MVPVSRLPLVALVLATAALPALAADRPSGHTHAFLDPLGKLWEVPGRDGLDVWFAATDTNHDGKIDRTEIVAEAQSWFQTLDLNHDGVIDPDEETAYENDRTGAHGNGSAGSIADDEPESDAPEEGGGRGRGGFGGRGGRHGHRGGGELAGGSGFGGGPGGEDRTGALMDVTNPVVSADVNLDRGISEQEAVNAASTRLSRLDLDGDGRLTLAEARQRRDAQASTVRSRAHPTAPLDAQPSPQ